MVRTAGLRPSIARMTPCTFVPSERLLSVDANSCQLSLRARRMTLSAASRSRPQAAMSSRALLWVALRLAAWRFSTASATSGHHHAFGDGRPHPLGTARFAAASTASVNLVLRW